MQQTRGLAKTTAVVLALILAIFFFGKLGSDIVADRQTTLANAEQLSRGFASALNEHALRTFSGAEGTIDSIIRGINATSSHKEPGEAELHRMLSQYQFPGSVLATLFVAKPGGTLAAISTEYPVRQVPVADREYFQHHQQISDGTLFISKPFLNRLDHTWLITATKRISGPDGSLRFIVGVSIRTQYFSTFYSTLELGRGDRVMLMRRDGRLLSLEPFSEQYLQVDLSPTPLMRYLNGGRVAGTFRDDKGPLDGSDRIVSYRSGGFYPIVAIISLDRQEELRHWRERSLKELAGAVLFAVLVVTLGYLVRRQLHNLQMANRRLSLQQVELQESEERVRLSEQRFRQLLENVQLVSIILDRSGRVTFCNEFLLQLTGWRRDEVVGADWVEVFLPPEQRVEMRARLMQGLARNEVPVHLEMPIITRDGDRRPISWDNTVLHSQDGTVSGIASIGMDLTLHRALEEQLRQSQKMEATGLLAGGIAHDFNNILTVIIGYGSVLQMRMEPDDPNRAGVEQIIAAADRAATLTRSLLAFSRKQIINPQQVDLNTIVHQVEHFLRRVIGEDITLKAELHGEPLLVLADSGQIEQVLMNLATNARDAMPEGGTLTVRTDSVQLDPSQPGCAWCTPGRYALLSFSDTGTGMDEATRNKIFEPFFTTKEVGKGTGLGLAMAYGTVMQHNGQILVESEPGKGTRFRIYLPLVASSAPGEVVETATTQPHAGNETILLAEDEPAVRELVQGLLTRFGYRVLVAEDGAQAVARFREHRDEIDLLLLDLIMPKLSGKGAYDEIVKIRPDIRVIFTSGYTAEVIRSKGELAPGIELIMKPVHPQHLLQKIRESLDR
jgi:PAS domain S-box-containing protein